MARNIEDLFVRLKLEGFENLDKIKGSFRELNKVTGFTETEVSNLRKEVLEFGKAAGNTEAVTKGVISVLQGLRTQADLCGNAYTQLTNDLKRLNEVARGSTDTLEKQRQALLNSADAGRQNVDSLQRQIDALKQLQRETRPGSSAFIQLGKDIDAVTVKLGKLKSEAQAFNLALNQQAGATPSVLNNQIAILQRGLQNVRYDAEQFVNTLRQLQLLQITQSGRTGRAGVIASFEAYQSREYLRGFADPSRLRAMPDTTAALNQELAELSDRLANTARGSSTYTDVAIRMAEVQRQLRTDVMGTSEAFRQLSIVEAGAERRAGKLASIQDYYSTQGPLAPGVGGYRDPATGAIIARGAYTPGRIRVEESAYPRPIGPQPFPEAATAAQRQVEVALKEVNAIYERSYVQRAELQSKYEQIHVDKLLEGLDLEGQVRQRAFTQELADFDKQLAARESRRRRRLTGMQLAQGVGAALSGGIFGGPEGLIGGAAGLAVGGVGGAFAGAAFGAQLGMVRQSAAAAATYAAEIRRLQIALQGIVTSFDDYKAALTAVESTSRMFNTPIREATQQFTKLSAAVIGSGGSIKDAETTFKGLTASVLATGGTVEDVNGALVAAAQVFSKGKVSAEELRGQIGERLAGAFALFAEASGRSTQGLDAALKSGEVTIADFVKFTQFSLEKYGRTAQIIASSPEQAGARLDNALKNLQRNIGDSLGPAGASFQDFATRSVRGIDKVIGKLIELGAVKPGAGYYESLVLGKGLSIGQLENQLLEAGQKATQSRKALGSVGLGFVAGAFPEVREAEKQARILEEALVRLRLIEKETNKERKQRITEEQNTKKEKAASSLLAAIDQREKALAEARVQREEQIAEIRKQSLEQARQLERQFADERRALERELSRTARNTTDINADITRQQRILAGEDPRIVEAEQRIADIYRQARERDIQIKEEFNDRELTRARTVADFQKNAADQINKANVAYAKSVGKIHREYARDVSKALDESSGKAAKRMATATQLLQVLTTLNLTGMYRYQAGFSPVPAEKDRTPEYNQLLQRRDRLEKQLQSRRPSPDATADRFVAAYAAQPQFEDIATTSLQGLLARTSGAGGPVPLPVSGYTGAQGASSALQAGQQEQNRRDTVLKITTEQENQLRVLIDQRVRLEDQNKLYQLQQKYIRDGIRPALVDTYAQADLEAARLKVTNAELTPIIDEQVRKIKELASAYEDAQQAARFAQDNRVGKGLREGAMQYVQSIGTLREATSQLAQTGIKGVEDALFSLVTTGTANFREFAASILKDTARMILQQMILRQVMQIFSPISSSSTAANFEMPGAAFIPQGGFKLNALGAAYAANGIQPFARGGAFSHGVTAYAMGGVVKQPTMFAFANGGAGRLGLMGEAGPEAIMPLRRLPSGRLGVESSGGGGMNVVVNVDASGSQVQGNSTDASQLGKVLSAAVQQELINQQRPGGLLAPKR